MKQVIFFLGLIAFLSTVAIAQVPAASQAPGVEIKPENSAKEEPAVPIESKCSKSCCQKSMSKVSEGSTPEQGSTEMKAVHENHGNETGEVKSDSKKSCCAGVSRANCMGKMEQKEAPKSEESTPQENKPRQ
jgi:hypothetical protein